MKDVTTQQNLTRRQAIGCSLAAGVCFGAGPRSASVSDVVGAAEPQVRVRPWARHPAVKLPLLGFGCADRFPQKKGFGKHSVDYEAAGRLVDYAMSHGVNWFDTGYVYHKGESERFLGKALAKYPRESYLLTDKMPTWLVKKPEDGPRMFAEQLERCKVDYFDFYFLHSVGSKSVFEDVYVKMGVLDYLRSEKKKGRIRHLGLSFHGKSDFLAEVLDANPDLEACLVMLNRMEYEWNKDAAKLADVAAKRGVAVLVMEPLAGGRAANLRGQSLAVLEKARPGDTAARWGLRFAASEPGVVCLFSGMNKLEHLKENIETLSETFRPFDAQERKTYDEAIAVYMKHPSIPCTGCRYCDPCPYGVRIPELFAWYNEWAQTGRLPSENGANDSQDLRRRFLASYNNAFPPKTRADRCLGCKKCLVSCPQWTFRIPVEMEKIANLVAQVEADYVKKGGTLR